MVADKQKEKKDDKVGGQDIKGCLSESDGMLMLSCCLHIKPCYAADGMSWKC